MKALQKITPSQMQSAAPASWSQVKYWATTAARGAMVSAAAMVMCGFTLADLRKAMAAQGKRTDLCDTTSPHDAAKLDGCGWQDNVKKYAGVSDDTARRWILTAEGVKAKWRKAAPQDRIRELMHHPVSDWTAADTELIFRALAKAIDGATMVEFMRELGLAKKLPRGTGREPGCDGTKKVLSMAEEVELRRQLAREDWLATEKMHRAYRDKFVLLTDEEIVAQVATLERDLKARQTWLKQPANQRDAKAIEAMYQ